MDGAAPPVMREPPMTAAALRGMIAAIAAVSIFAFGLSLSVPLISINLERMGASGLMIGLSGGAAAVATVFGGVVMPGLRRRFSLPQIMLAGLVAMALLLQVFPLFPDPVVWIALRFIFGFAVTALFFSSELWIIAAAPPGRRGVMIGIYGLFLSLGFLAGPLLLRIVGTEGALPFLIGGGLSLLGLPAVLIAWRDTPNFDEAEEGSLGAIADVIGFFRSDPAILWAVVLFAVIEFGTMSLLPVWGLRVGMTEAAALILIALLAAGNVVMQVPLGWLGDKFDRRRLLGISASISLFAAVALPLFAQTTWPLWITALIWGALAVGLYSFALIELGSRYVGAALARATGAVMTAYGIGALVSPPLLGLAMDLMPPHGMFGLLALAATGYIALLVLRRGRTG